MSLSPGRAPEGSVCPDHPAASAPWACPRCGRFLCEGCARRPRPEALPLCPACWALREKVVEKTVGVPGSRLFNVGLGLSIASFLPALPLIIGSFVVNGIALARAARDPQLQPHRWKAITGLALSGAAVVLWMLILVFAVAVR